MINAKRIGTNIIAHFAGKLYQKDFKDLEKVLEVYDFLTNASESNAQDTIEFKEFFKSEKTDTEKQLEIEFEKKKEESKKLVDILDLMKEIKATGDDLFEVVENSIYIKGIKISVPELLVREIIKARESSNEDRLKALINFWSLCALNPDPRARHDAFRFIQNHKLTVTSSGNFLTYRRVHTKKKNNPELEKFITQEYMKVKRWKKSPKNYEVHEDDDTFKLIPSNSVNSTEGHNYLGNLDELYNNITTIDNSTIYTDNRTKTFNIQIGVPMKEDRGKVDPDPEVECSVGIHSGSPYYVNNNSWLGEVVLACLVNPKNITAVPKADSYKMRACEILPIAIAELDENGNIIEPDYEVFDLELAQNTQEELEDMARLSSTELEEYKKHEFIAPEVDYNMVSNILDRVIISVEEANKKIQNRVIKV